MFEAHKWERGTRKAIADVCHRLYERNYLVATSGNVSVRQKEGLLITPAATRKDAIGAESIVECAADGTPVQAGTHPSSETAMHRMKCCFGNKLKNHVLENQQTETKLRSRILNHFTHLGLPTFEWC